jgi:hypothetical protein
VVLLPPGDAHPFFGVGFGTPGATVYVPLSSRHGLWGMDFDLDRTPGLEVAVIESSDRKVAALNSAIITRAHRFLYAGSPDFSWLRGDGRLGNFEDLQKVRGRQDLGTGGM